MKFVASPRILGRDVFFSISAGRELWWVTTKDGYRDTQILSIKVRTSPEFEGSSLLILIVWRLCVKFGWHN